MMNKEYNLITQENIQKELINNEIEQINLRVQAFKEQKYNELLKENKDLQQRINEAIQYVKNNIVYDTGKPYRRDLLQILGGDVDDE